MENKVLHVKGSFLRIESKSSGGFEPRLGTCLPPLCISLFSGFVIVLWIRHQLDGVPVTVAMLIRGFLVCSDRLGVLQTVLTRIKIAPEALQRHDRGIAEYARRYRCQIKAAGWFS